MAASPLLPALVLERASLEPLATVSILHTLRPVASRLRGVLNDLPGASTEWIDSLLERTGSAIVFQGHPSAALHLDGLLRRAGLTTSVNFLPISLRGECRETPPTEEGDVALT